MSLLFSVPMTVSVEKTEDSAPEFILVLHSCNVAEGEDGVLECRVTGKDFIKMFIEMDE